VEALAHQVFGHNLRAVLLAAVTLANLLFSGHNFFSLVLK
jgi:hypothetical protein